MKKILSSLLIAACLFTAMPAKKAEAGILLTGAVIAIHHGNDAIMLNGILTGGAITAVGGILTAIGWTVPGAILLILDEDGQVQKNELQKAFSERYSFIQDEEFFNNLTHLTDKKIENATQTANGIEVKFTEGELNSLLDKTDAREVYPEETALMIQELM